MGKISLILVIVLAALAATVAYACACGAYIPEKPGPVVVDEKALVRWDGTTEDIVMALGVEGTSKKAAWIMPVPSAAKITLADARLFDELAEATKPRTRYEYKFWPELRPPPFLGGAGGSAPGDKGVEVLGRQRLGPFDVTRLAAANPTALADWLGSEGFPKPATLDAGLKPYVDEGWEIVAVKLAPAAGDALTGTLQPLRLTFATDRAVYPMRLSHHAKRIQSVQLYVLADYRMDTGGPTEFGSPTTRFAGRIEPGPKAARLATYLAGGTTYLTRFDGVYPWPSAITRDFAFTRAKSDQPFRETIVVVRDWTAFVGPTIMGIFILLAVVLVVVSQRNRRRRLALV